MKYLSAEMIDAMVSSGCTAEQIAAVVKAGLLSYEAELQEKRANDRERQARHRMSRDVTVTGRDPQEQKGVPLPPLVPPPFPNNPNHPPIIPPSPPQKHTIGRPDDVDEQVWRDFEKHRRAKRAPITATALAQIRREAEKAGFSMNDTLREIIGRNWQGVKAEWLTEEKNGTRKTTKSQQVGDVLAGALAKLDQQFMEESNRLIAPPVV